MKERLQKLIASAGLASRRQAEEWIEGGRVTVNGQVARLGDRADPGRDRVEVDGKVLGRAPAKICVLLNKPSGYVTSLKDPQGRPVVSDLVKSLGERLFPVGRLDYNTEGLLLLTNDGDLAQRLAHPRHKVNKTYLVRVRGQLDARARTALERGVSLGDGMTAPARVARLRHSGGHSWFELTIREGRNRQVRRMCEKLGYPVSRLRRIRVAFLELGDLQPGAFRLLSAREVSELKRL